MIGWDEPSVVGELPLNQTGHDGHVVDYERCFAICKPDGEFLGIAQQTPGHLKGPGRNQHRLITPQNRGSRKVTHGQAIRIGGHETETIIFGSQQNTGENRARVVTACGLDHLFQCS